MAHNREPGIGCDAGACERRGPEISEAGVCPRASDTLPAVSLIILSQFTLFLVGTCPTPCRAARYAENTRAAPVLLWASAMANLSSAAVRIGLADFAVSIVNIGGMEINAAFPTVDRSSIDQPLRDESRAEQSWLPQFLRRWRGLGIGAIQRGY